MKKISFTLMLTTLLLFAGGCLSTAHAAKKLPKQDKLVLFEKIYAVPGVECNIYFKNIFLAINHANYIFDVNCKVGRHDLKRWRFTPKAEDGGKSFPLSIKVYNESGLVAEASTTIHVAHADAGKDKKINILMVGDSYTNHTVYPAWLYELCKKSNAPALNMIGTRRYEYKGANIAPEVRSEGYSGWRWDSFLTRWDGPARKGRKYTKSKFLYMKDGKVTVSLTEFLKTYKFPTPDIITVQLGGNDTFHLTDENRDEKIKEILENADKLLAVFRKDAPNAIIGVGLPPPCANQDAFGNSYKCGQTSWGKNKNRVALTVAMIEHFKNKDPKIILIPTYAGIDSENNYPFKKEPVNAHNPTIIARQSNGVHADISGYRQAGDIYYAWLKNMLMQK